MSSEEEKNMALVRRFWEAQAKGDLDTLDELLAPDFVTHHSMSKCDALGADMIFYWLMPASHDSLVGTKFWPRLIRFDPGTLLG